MSRSGETRITSIPGKRRFQFDCLPKSPELKEYGTISLYQFGDLTCDAGFELGEHKQVCYEITYIVSGKGWFATNGVRYEVQAGDLYIGLPGELHRGGADAGDPFRYFYVGYHFNLNESDGSWLLPIKQMIDNKQSPLCKGRLDVRSPFVNVLKELSSVTPFSHKMIQLYLEQILVLTYRNFFSDWQAKYPGEGAKHGTKRAVYAAIQYIDDHLLKIGDLKEVSDALGYSLSYLSHLVTQETGDNLRSICAKRKWEKTVELLKEGSYSITEIAAIIKYNSIHTFSRAFRKTFGMSPSRYIRERIGESPGEIAEPR
ncbi:AraC family transcriptional regulator [Paenibacillus mesophilus]|uniref:AraC family transcriptional regulator n=1 Tax=Paenibacillus mesophilus TaxID=2582849 RepID=UPI00110DA8B1|nr:AraC family transcriptional regulator [Paenibacillus mesophilus]TMV42738.1 AraC family transcriptional regulator [Paenibacillus mesophilus]